MQDLIAAFMPKFVASAQKRLARSLELATQASASDTHAIAREMHAIAGEAGLLGIDAVVALARAAETEAKRLRATGSESDVAALVASLYELKRTIELVLANQKGPNES